MKSSCSSREKVIFYSRWIADFDRLKLKTYYKYYFGYLIHGTALVLSTEIVVDTDQIQARTSGNNIIWLLTNRFSALLCTKCCGWKEYGHLLRFTFCSDDCLSIQRGTD